MSKLNKRLLTYKLPDFNYKKINNTAYVKRNYNKLLLNYYWNKTGNLKNTVIFTRKLSNSNWFNVLLQLGVVSETTDKNSFYISVINNRCKECSLLINPKQKYCSIKCLNVNKSKNPEFIKKLSKSIKESYNTASISSKQSRIANIRLGVINHNKLLDTSERKEKYSNHNLRFTAYDNLLLRFPNIELLFDSVYFYNNKYLPVKCKDCNFKWEMTKTTNIARSECRKCIPFKKHKTQTEIFDFINNIIPAKENAKMIISNELDIYINRLNFAIEYNGLLPHSFGKSRVSYYNYDYKSINVEYHLRKTEECENLGIELWHIFENEFLNKTKRKIWFSKISNKLGQARRVFGRKCVIKEIQTPDSKEFLINNHLQGNCNSSIKLGLFYQDELVSVMTFRKHKKYQWEIARFATILDTTVVGGASKLLKYFELNYKPESIISYANRRWSTGNLYEQIGFEFIKNTPPNYFYFRENENILYTREQFQKHKLKEKLKLFDSELTEIENMLNNNYRIIYDCGNKQYVKYYSTDSCSAVSVSNVNLN